MPAHRLLLSAVLILSPAILFAAGVEEPAETAAPPEPTKTTTECAEGEVYDEKEQKCLKAEETGLNDDQRFRAVRELAYAGRPESALRVLAAMTEGDTDRVMTYKGFAHRKAGHVEDGILWYERALAANPGNSLARSYYGQLLVEMAETEAAQAQLDEIRARGGAGSWAEASLAQAIITGNTLSY